MTKGIKKLLVWEAIGCALVVGLASFLCLLDIFMPETGKLNTAEKMHEKALLASAIYVYHFLVFIVFGHFNLGKPSSKTAVALASIVLMAGLMYAVVRFIILPMFV